MKQVGVEGGGGKPIGALGIMGFKCFHVPTR